MNQADEDALIDKTMNELGIFGGGASFVRHNKDAIRLAIRAAVAHERERAAKVCDIEAEDGNTCAEYFAAAIRRGEP